MLDKALTFRMIWLLSLNEDDGLLRPEIKYRLSNRTAVRFGADVFYGTRKGFFGQFREKDRLVLGVEMGF
jgi:hypothetical protein